MKDEEKESVISDYLTAYNKLDVEGMIALVHPKVTFVNIYKDKVNARAEGLEQLCELANKSKALFSSRHQEAIKFNFIGDRVKVDIAFEGVLAADLSYGMKAGDTLRFNGSSEFEFKDDKLYKITDSA